MIQRKVDQQNFEKILGELKNQNLISKNKGEIRTKLIESFKDQASEIEIEAEG